MMTSFFNHKSLALIAVVATLFSAIVALLLIRDFMGRSESDVIESEAIVALRQKLRDQPGDQQLREQIRERDRVMREDYFRSRQYNRHGAYLLVGGMGLAALAGTIAMTLGRRALRPSAVLDDGDSASIETRSGLRAVVILTGLLAAGSLALAWNYRTALNDWTASSERPGDGSGGTAGVLTPPDDGQAAVGGSPDSDGSETLALPSQEEIQRNWPTFRGPEGAGTALAPESRITWDLSSGEGVVWKSPISLPGNNSPVVWEDRVFLCGATSESRRVFCFDAKTGDLLWQHEVQAAAGAGPEEFEVSDDTGYAAPTAATDGRRVYAMFAQGDVAALDVSGRPLWTRNLGAPKNIYGHASSLALAGELLIIQYDQGSKKENKSKLLALHVLSGETVWETAREVPNSWSSPVVIQHEGQPQIITCADPWVIAYAVEDGQELWRVKCLRQDVGPTPVYSSGTLFVASEFPGISAIRAGGQGDVTESHVLWTAEFGAPDTCSPLVSDGLLMVLASFGTLTCYDVVEGGDPLWEVDFDDTFRSSPTRIGQDVYLIGESGKVWIVQPTREECPTVEEVDLGEVCVTSPAVVGGRIFVRGEQHLFCLGE